jgi:hypothetical protein
VPDLMTAANRAITAVLVALALAGSACAGLTPTSLPVAGPVPSSAAPERISPPPAEVSDLGGDWSADFALDRVPVASLPEGNAAAAPAHVEAKPVQVLADHQSSLSESCPSAVSRTGTTMVALPRWDTATPSAPTSARLRRSASFSRTASQGPFCRSFIKGPSRPSCANPSSPPPS